MASLMREAPIGRLVRLATQNRYFRYPEEEADFVLPERYAQLEEKPFSSPTSTSILTFPKGGFGGGGGGGGDDAAGSNAPTVVAEAASPETRSLVDGDLEGQLRPDHPIAPRQTADGVILVDWDDTADAANPKNWSAAKKACAALIVCTYTFAVYVGSAIYISSEPSVRVVFGVSEQVAALPLSLYVLAYGVGPMLWAPLSEIPSIGRNPVYSLTFFIFVVVSIPTAAVNSFSGLVVLRVAQGFFGSPCLANGGASMADLFSDLATPYGLTVWVSACFAGPALGPLLSGYAVTAMGWRWSLWEIVWLAAPVCILLILFLPETHAPTILHERAARLRKLTGSSRFQSQSEIDQSHMTAHAIMVDALIKPGEIFALDPAVAFTNIYTSWIYSIYYSFFEVFPLVFPPLYGFNLGELGISFTCIIVSCVIGAGSYVIYLYFFLNPSLKGVEPVQEQRLKPALFAVFGPPVGLFLFGWTARADIHWIVCIMGVIVFSVGNFVLLQCLSIYLSRTYPKYAASLFAANDFCRSAMACAAIHFSPPLFKHLGIGKGVSLLASLSGLGVAGMFVLFRYGGKMRARSTFAVS